MPDKPVKTPENVEKTELKVDLGRDINQEPSDAYGRSDCGQPDWPLSSTLETDFGTMTHVHEEVSRCEESFRSSCDYIRVRTISFGNDETDQESAPPPTDATSRRNPFRSMADRNQHFRLTGFTSPTRLDHGDSPTVGSRSPYNTACQDEIRLDESKQFDWDLTSITSEASDASIASDAAEASDDSYGSRDFTKQKRAMRSKAERDIYILERIAARLQSKIRDLQCPDLPANCKCKTSQDIIDVPDFYTGSSDELDEIIRLRKSLTSRQPKQQTEDIKNNAIASTITDQNTYVMNGAIPKTGTTRKKSRPLQEASSVFKSPRSVLQHFDTSEDFYNEHIHDRGNTSQVDSIDALSDTEQYSYTVSCKARKPMSGSTSSMMPREPFEINWSNTDINYHSDSYELDVKERKTPKFKSHAKRHQIKVNKDFHSWSDSSSTPSLSSDILIRSQIQKPEFEEIWSRINSGRSCSYESLYHNQIQGFDLVQRVESPEGCQINLASKSDHGNQRSRSACSTINDYQSQSLLLKRQLSEPCLIFNSRDHELIVTTASSGILTPSPMTDDEENDILAQEKRLDNSLEELGIHKPGTEDLLDKVGILQRFDANLMVYFS